MSKKVIPFGAMAIKLGYASASDISLALKEQEARNKVNEHLVLGMLMVEMGVISDDQLSAILLKQKKTNLGNIFPLSEDAIRLATRLKVMQSESDKVILFTSSHFGEGVSRITTGIACALALMEQGEVLLIDSQMKNRGNKRALDLVEQFDIESAPGLYELLAYNAALDDCVKHASIPNLFILPTGDAEDDYISLFMSTECVDLFSSLRKRFRHILIDTIPISKFPDAGLLVPHSDGVVFVAEVGKRSKTEVLEMKQIVDGLSVPILGTVLSRRD